MREKEVVDEKCNHSRIGVRTAGGVQLASGIRFDHLPPCLLNYYQVWLPFFLSVTAFLLTTSYIFHFYGHT